jgi:membrane protein DedA with SNARE-associated domain
MDIAIHAFVVFLQHNVFLAVVIALLAAACESLVLIGAFIPGTALILALGAASGLGYLPLWPLILAATIGAILGDGLSYWIGHAHRDRIAAVWPFSSRPEILQAGESFFGRYGWAGIALARFLPGVRAIVPVVAGTSGMRPLPFYAANVGSAIVWAPVHLVPAALAGSGIASATQLSPQGEITIVVGAVLLGMTIWWLIRHRAGLAGQFVEWFQHNRRPPPQ